MVTEPPALSFAGLLRQLRAETKLTQEELAAAAGVSPRSVSNLERGINRTAHKDTAVLLAGALGLTEPTEELFVAAARGNVPPAQVLAAAEGAAPRPTAVAGSPYRGLAAFGEQDAGWFFGREAAAITLLERMSRLLAGVGVLVVSGASGAGKSSLLRAGVLPQIRAGGLASAPGAAWWPRVVFTPTRAPLDELALRVAPLAGTDASAVRRGLAADPAWFALTVRQAALARPGGSAGDPDGRSVERDQLRQRRMLLVVDQFEELFTQCAEEGQRRAFVIALHAAATAGHGPDQTPAALVVLGVRADFEARCADYPQLAGPVQDRYLVTAMTGRQLRMAITEPAKKAGSHVDGDLTDLLLAEVRTGQPGTSGAGVLPLLSHALDQAWRSRTGEALTLADYERTGGIEGAVAASAQRAYDGLTPAQQAAARQVFMRLTATSSDGVDYADRATRAELTEGKSPTEAQDVEAVLEAFAAERLLTLAAGTVELSHEAVLTAWPLLRDTWLADTHADRIVHTRLHTTAADWAHHSRDPSYLYSGTLLAAATGTATRIAADPARHPPLSQTERDFLHASSRAHRRTVRRWQAVIAGLLALLTVGGIAVYNAATAARNAASAARNAASSLSALNCGIEVLELDPGILSGEAPVDPTSGAVARRLPFRDLPLQGRPVGQPPVQALLRQHGKLDLGHVQPAPMLGRVVQLQPIGQPLRLGRLERLIQRRGRVGVEVVLDQHDLLSVGVTHIEQVLDAVRPVDPGAPRTDRHVPPPAQRLTHQEGVAHPPPLVLVVLPCPPPRRDRPRRGDFRQQLPTGLVQADLRVARVIRPGVDRQHVLHAPDKLGVVLGWDAPALGQPRLEPVCFKACRTVSYDTDPITSSSTSRSASSRNVQRLRPSGGALHASATKWASCSPSSLRRYSRAGGLRYTAASSPAATYFMRTRATVAGLTSSAAPMAASVQPGPASPWLALSRTRAWVSALAGATPRPIMVCSRARSSSDRTTMCRLRTSASLQRRYHSTASMRPNLTSHKSRLTSY